MPIPSNLAQFVPKAEAKPVEPAPAVPQAPQSSGGVGLMSSIASGVKSIGSAIGGLFGHKDPAPVQDTPGKVPHNLESFIQKTPEGKSKAVTPAPASAGKVPTNLQAFLPKTAQKKSEPEKPNFNPKENQFGDLFKSNPAIQTSTPSFISPTLNQAGKTPSIVTKPEDTFYPNSDVPPDFVSGVANTAKDIAQMIPRTAYSIGTLLGQSGESLANFGENKETKDTSVPRNMEWLLGSGEVKSPAQEMDEVEQTIKNSPLAKKLGVDKFSKQISFAGVLGNDFLTFEGLGEGELASQSGREVAINLLRKATTEEEVLPILEKIGMNSDLAVDIAPHLADMTDKKEISDALDLAENLQKARSALPDIAEMEKGAHTEGYTPSIEGSAGEGLPAEVIHPGETPATETMPAEIIHPGDTGQSVVTSTFGDIQSPGNTASSMAMDSGSTRTQDLSTQIAKSTDPVEIKTLLQTTGVDPEEITQMTKQLAKIDSPAEVHSIIEGFDIPQTPRKQITLPSELEQKQQAIEIKRETLANNPLSNLEKYVAKNGDMKGSLPELGQGGSKFAKTGDVIIDNAVGHGQYSEDVRTQFNDEYLPQKEELRKMEEDFKQEKKQYLESIKPPGPPPVYGPKPVPPADPKTDKTIKEIMRGNVERIKGELGQDAPPTGGDIKASPGDQLEAVMNANDGGVPSGPFKGWKTETVRAFQDFVNRRKFDTLEAVGAIVRKQFEPLRAEGIDGILRFEGYERDDTGHIVESKDGPERSGMYGQVSTTNDQFYNTEVEAGVPVKYRANYLRLYLYDPKTGARFIDGVPQLSGRKVGQRPAFALPRQFTTYAEAIEAGYKPIYNNLADIMQQRAMESERAIANSEFFHYLTQTGNAVPQKLVAEGAGSSFISFDPDRFPTQTTQFEGKVYSGTYKGPAPIVEKVNHYLQDPNFSLFKTTASAFGAVKNIALSIGIPKTGLTVHYWNMLPREVLADIAISPLTAPKEIAKFLYYGLWTKAARNYIDQNLEKALPFMRAGMTFSSEEHQMKALELVGDTYAEKAGTVGKWVGNTLHNAFAKGVFSRIIPARKLYQAQRMFDYFVKKGMTPDEAYRAAAVHVNELYGGINWEQMGRSKDFQNVLRSGLIAPDFAEGNIKIGANMVKGLGRLFKNSRPEMLAGAPISTPGSPQSSMYRNFVYAFISVYITANIINYETTGKFIWDNDPLHQLSIASGYDKNGKTRYVNFFGTGADFYRVPAQIVSSLAHGNINDVIAVLRNRLSIPLADAISMMSNTDWAGQRIYGPDLYGNPQSTGKQIQNIFNNTIGTVAPAGVTSVEKLASGQVTPEQAIVQGAGFPIGYVNEKPNSVTIKALEQKAKDGIVKGDYTLYNKLVKAKVISSRSRAAFIRSALTNGAKTQRQIRTATKTKAALTQKEENLKNMGFTKNSI